MPNPPAASCRVVLTGSLGGGEVFAWGFWLNTDSVITTQADADAIANAVKSAFNASVAPFVNALGTTDSYQGITCYFYGASGLSVKSQVTNTQVGVGSQSHPLQSCVVLSLRSATLTGRGRGRCFVPYTGGSLTNHQLTAAQAAALAGAAATMFNTLNTTPVAGHALQVVVYSVADGNTKRINQIVVDSRPDTQRRRALQETVTAVASAGV